MPVEVSDGDVSRLWGSRGLGGTVPFAKGTMRDIAVMSHHTDAYKSTPPNPSFVLCDPSRSAPSECYWARPGIGLRPPAFHPGFPYFPQHPPLSLQLDPVSYRGLSNEQRGSPLRTDSDSHVLEHQRTRTAADSDISGLGKQRTRKATDSDSTSNGLGQQGTWTAADSDSSGLGQHGLGQPTAGGPCLDSFAVTH